MAAPPPNTTVPNLPPKDDENPGYVSAENDTYYNRRPSKIVKERPIRPVSTATGALPATGPNGALLSKETSSAKTLIDPDALPEGLHPRDPAIKHHLLDEYRVWNIRWRGTEIVNNKATLETLPAILRSGKELEEHFRLCLQDDTVEASVLEALGKQHKELKAQLEYTRGVIGKLETRGRKVERRRAAAIEKARKAEGGSGAVGKGRGEEEGKIERVDGEDAAEKSEKATTETVGSCKSKKVFEALATTNAGSGAECLVDLTMSCTPAQDDVEDVTPKKSTLELGHSSVAMAGKHSHGSRGKRSDDYAVSTTQAEKERGHSSSKRKRDEETRPPKHKGHKDTGHGTGVGDFENGLAVRNVKRARSIEKRIEEAPDPAQQALNGRRRNILKALLRVP